MFHWLKAWIGYGPCSSCQKTGFHGWTRTVTQRKSSYTMKDGQKLMFYKASLHFSDLCEKCFDAQVGPWAQRAEGLFSNLLDEAPEKAQN